MASIYRLGTKWRAQVRLKGKPAQSEVFATKAEAVAWTRTVEGALHKKSGGDEFALYSEIHEQYFASVSQVGATKDKICKSLLKYWGGYRLSEITPKTISDYALKRKGEGVEASTVLTDLVYFGVVLQHGGMRAGNQEALAAKQRLAGAVKTLRNLRIVASSNQRSRRPTEEELVKLRDYFCGKKSSVPMWELVLFAITTALRLGEIVGVGGIVWDDVDVNNRLLTVRARKDPESPQGFDMTIPLLRGPVVVTREIFDPLDVILRQKTAYARTGRVFPFAETTITDYFRTACAELQVNDLHFHDLRHDAISRFFEYGYTIPEVAAVSGHRSWASLKRYTQIRPATLHEKT